LHFTYFVYGLSISFLFIYLFIYFYIRINFSFQAAIKLYNNAGIQVVAGMAGCKGVKPMFHLRGGLLGLTLR